MIEAASVGGINREPSQSKFNLKSICNELECCKLGQLENQVIYIFFLKKSVHVYMFIKYTCYTKYQ
jgi:hypothetical protein